MNISPDKECKAYSGVNFQLKEQTIKFRKAKITPKKTGLFVTLWKRNANGQTEPFPVTEPVDFYIIAAEKDQNKGFFLFPKAVLAEKRILTENGKEGKRGFRVYPAWDIPENKQAEKTQNWQKSFFIDMSQEEKIGIEKFRKLFFECTFP
ncbi:MepB family protein [Fluviicola sp.]|uniref:MepB family protein n=1 Tax=Fluviicola sp. TaxID=1917219 RepID=UPI0026038009|nr:MepB family protein [Fluviicola sp.]